MKYIKSYESINYNDIYNIIKKSIKLIDKKYSVYLTATNNIEIWYSKDKTLSEIICKIQLNINVLIFKIYKPNYELCNLLKNYFTLTMNKIYNKNNEYSFYFDSKTKLNIKDFKSLISVDKFNL